MRTAALWFASIVVVTAASIGAACSSNTTIYRNGDSDGGPIGNEGGAVDAADGGVGVVVDAGAEAGAPGETNPYGRPYPTANIGWRIRAGSVPGNVIANLKLTGYKVGSTTSETIPLAYVYDPDGNTHDLVAMLVVAAWDTYSKQLATRLGASGLPARVAMMSVLGQGATVGTPPSAVDFDAWRLQLKDVIHVTDPDLAALKPLGEIATAFPSIVILDARTMEIVSADLGMPADPKAEIEAFRDATKTRPASY